MAHWIVDDKGLAGTYWTCSACRDYFCDLFHDISNITEKCPTCGSHMDEEAVEYLRDGKKEEPEPLKRAVPTAEEARAKVMGSIEKDPKYIAIIGNIDNEICIAIEKRKTSITWSSKDPYLTDIVREMIIIRYGGLGYSCYFNFVNDTRKFCISW